MNPFKKMFCRLFQLGMRAALPVMPYREPVRVNGLAGVPPLLRDRGIARVLLVTDSQVRSLGLTAPLEESLEKAGMFCAVYDKTVANPTTDNVEEALALYQSENCQALIGFGGGSSRTAPKRWVPGWPGPTAPWARWRVC